VNTYKIGSENIDLILIKNILDSNQKIELSKSQANIVNESREFLEKKINSSNEPIYGVNTGFGSLHNIKIDSKQLNKLQENLLL
jgi:histidine ammonia-lyase